MATQGPKAMDLAVKLFGDHVRDFKYFGFADAELHGIALVIARSGWSKQGGFEMYLMDSARGIELWDIVKDAGAEFDIGPGAPNDTERLESGLISYGADMRVQTHPATPFEVGFGPLISFEHDFVGRSALQAAAKTGPVRTLIGVVIDGTPTPPGHPVPLQLDGQNVGYVSEFAFSKRLGKTIGIGLIRSDLASTSDTLALVLPTGTHAATLAETPFV
ncbi:glycine cleavage T C-terminal barrel domain-containing protein [Sulfitobacter aestuariivivens]